MPNCNEEITAPTWVDLVTAYQLLGIDNLIGAPGKRTAFGSAVIEAKSSYSTSSLADGQTMSSAD